MVTKGAVEEMLSICKYVEDNKEVKEVTEQLKEKILNIVNELNEKGFRVLALAKKKRGKLTEEVDMVLIGYLAFLDPPKESTESAIKALKKHGVSTKVLTGDNDLVTRTVCKQVGLKINNMFLGSEIEQMDDKRLKIAVEVADVFAKLSPEQKTRIVSMLRENGHVVGFLGDGINCLLYTSPSPRD